METSCNNNFITPFSSFLDENHFWIDLHFEFWLEWRRSELLVQLARLTASPNLDQPRTLATFLSISIINNSAIKHKMTYLPNSTPHSDRFPRRIE